MAVFRDPLKLFVRDDVLLDYLFEKNKRRYTHPTPLRDFIPRVATLLGLDRTGGNKRR